MLIGVVLMVGARGLECEEDWWRQLVKSCEDDW